MNDRHYELPLTALRYIVSEMGIEDDYDEYRIMIASELETLYEMEC